MLPLFFCLMFGTILLINGASSSGKSTLLRLLQDRLDPAFIDLGLDRFIFALPRRYLDRPLWDDVLGEADHAGATGLRLASGMHHAIAAAASAGLNVIADHVLLEKIWVDECARLFAGVPAYLVGLQCPLEVLEERERLRKDRTLGQARKQFLLVHRYVSYDLELDTSRLTVEECAQQVIARMQAPPSALKRLNPR